MQGEKVPKAQLRAAARVIKLSKQETPHTETPPKVRAGADANVINSFSVCTSAPRAPVCGRRIGLSPLELSSPTGRIPGIIPAAALPWGHITASEESWDECRGTWIKASGRALLLPPRWHCTKSKQVMKPKHSTRFNLPDIRIQMTFPTSLRSSVWPLIYSLLGNCFCCSQSTNPPSLPVPNSHVLLTHQTPPQQQHTVNVVSNPKSLCCAPC